MQMLGNGICYEKAVAGEWQLLGKNCYWATAGAGQGQLLGSDNCWAKTVGHRQVVLKGSFWATAVAW